MNTQARHFGNAPVPGHPETPSGPESHTTADPSRTGAPRNSTIARDAPRPACQQGLRLYTRVHANDY